jgi:hypothetical protein
MITTYDDAVMAMMEREGIMQDDLDPLEFETYKSEKQDFERRLKRYKEQSPELYKKITTGESKLFLWAMEKFFPEFLQLNKSLNQKDNQNA